MSPNFPPILILTTNLGSEELEELEEKVPSLTWDAHEAEVVVGRITRRERALFELRKLKIPTSEVTSGSERAELPASAVVKVVKIAWLTESLQQDTVLPIQPYLLYEGKKSVDSGSASRSTLVKTVPASGVPGSSNSPGSSARTQGAKETVPSTSSQKQTGVHPHHSSSRRTASDRPPLLHESTSEHNVPLPSVPEFLHTTYSCQRPTPVNSPNSAFIEQLKKVRTHRVLEGDKVGVRAYSTTIASIAAYPYPLQSSFEVSRLPGCGSRIAELFQRWKDTGELQEVAEAAVNPRTSVMQLFYDIWGVGETTAKDFYNKGWRDLDDLVEYGWGSLSRVQQIGVKYYDDFLLKIPRPEVRNIGSIVLDHARKIDPNFQMVIVGGYRRGKEESGDVDVILSHPNEDMTFRLIEKIVMGLEKSHHITHTLSLSTRNSDRGQAPLPWTGEARGSSGFDTLDKALVVWKDPTMQDAPHRRVDLIVSPWKTVGCALLGWSGGTTFQRDLRRYCKAEKQLKFDSSGVRNRKDGRWVDLEGAMSTEPAPDMEAAERRVFEALGLEWRAPEERCTG